VVSTHKTSNLPQEIVNKIISGFNSLRFALTDPPRLQLARLKYEHLYTDKNEEPLISICLPTYNRARLLVELAVPSVLGQTYRNFELIIIGDHCTDETEMEVSKIKDPRIRFHNIPQRGYRYPPTAENHWFAGPVVALNQALKMVRGKWIARIDDDDIWTEDHLAALLDFAQKGDFEFVSARYERERYGKREVVAGEYAGGPYFNPKATTISGPRLGGTQTWAYRSYMHFFRYNINCWRKSWNRVNDIDLEYRIYKAGARIGFLDKVVGYILPRPGEETVGLEAYKMTEDEKLKHFEFDR
jgi:glycosyltransferase involved in cell wall biosynthesis